MNLYEIFGKNRIKLHPGTYGLEIETEVMDSEDYPDDFLIPNGVNEKGHECWKIPMSYWKAEADHSTRNFGVEYVLSVPLSYTSTLDALTEFNTHLGDVDFVKNAPGTSVHVHVNMLGQTCLTLANFLALWTMFEGNLTNYSGEFRRSNLFACGIRNAEMNIRNIIKLLRELDNGDVRAFLNLKAQAPNLKYAACNIGTLGLYGSVEIRCFRGTTDVKEIKDWLSIIDKIYAYSQTPGLTPERLLNEWKLKDMELITDIFGEYSDNIKTPDTEAFINRNLHYVVDIAEVCEDWYTFGMNYEKEKAPAPAPAPMMTKKPFGTILTDEDLQSLSQWVNSPGLVPEPLEFE